MTCDPKRPVSALCMAVAALAVACSAEDTDPTQAGFEGRLQITVSDFEDGRVETTYLLESEDGSELFLELAEPTELGAGTRVRVIGAAAKPGHITVRELVPLDAGSAESALARNTARAPSRLAALLISPGGKRDTRTPQTLRQSLFTGTSSTSAFYSEQSFGISSLTGDVYGWLDVPAMSGCDYATLRANARAAALRAGIDLSRYGQVLHYFPKTSACNWAGLAYVGQPHAPARDSFFNGVVGCTFHHELGHNYGMRHARSYSCTDGRGTGRVTLAPAARCIHREYGDNYDNQGTGCFQHSAYRKALQGWFGGCNVVSMASSATYDVAPLESPTDAIQALRVKVHPGLCPADIPDCHYYLEYRQRIGGFDLTSATQVYSGVLVRIAGAPDFGGRASSQTSTYLLDMNPATPEFEALPKGSSWTDPAGTKISVLAASTAVATVRVDIPFGVGRNVCIDGAAARASTTPLSGSGGAGGAPSSTAGGSAAAGASTTGTGDAASGGAGPGVVGGTSGAASGSATAGATALGGTGAVSGAPCDGLCTNATVFSGPNYQSWDLGTGAVCRETRAALRGGLCGNFSGSRELRVNGTLMACGPNWAALPAPRNGGYCFQASPGDHAWGYFATW